MSVWVWNDSFKTILNSVYPRYGYIHTSKCGCCRPGTDISLRSWSLHCDCSYSEQKRVFSQLFATTTYWMCQHNVAPTCWQFSTGFDTYWREFEWTAAERLVWGRKRARHSWGKMSEVDVVLKEERSFVRVNFRWNMKRMASEKNSCLNRGLVLGHDFFLQRNMKR